MADKLPGWSFMVIGVIMIVFVKFIESKQPAAKLGFFFYVGILFIAIGLYREIIPRLKSKQKKEMVGPPMRRPEHHSTHLHPAGHMQHGSSPHTTHQHIAPQQHPSHPYQPLHKQCPRCKQPTAAQARFCHNCGFQFY